MGATWTRLTERHLPANRTELYFHENALWEDAKKLLCCPTAVGCVVREYNPKDPTGGRPVYSVSKTSSYSEFVPRYEIRALGVPGRSLVGVLDKEETHLRTKLGEYICMSLWKVKHNSLVMKEHGRSVPQNSESFRMVLAQQAKIDVSHNEYQDTVIHSETERWFEMFSMDLQGFKARLPDRVYPTPEACTKLNLYWNGSRVGTAKKQGFAGALGGPRYGRPYVGLELAPSLRRHMDTKATLAAAATHTSLGVPRLPLFGGKRHAESHDTFNSLDDVGTREDNALNHLLSPERLRVLLLCLAWSEKTIDFPNDETENFIQAMRAHPSAPVSAKSKHFPASWNAQDLKRHLQVESTAWVQLHKWEDHPRAEDAHTTPDVALAVTSREDHPPAEDAHTTPDVALAATSRSGVAEEEEAKGPPVDPNDPLFV